MSSRYTYTDDACDDCNRVIRVWRYDGKFSHVGREGPWAKIQPDGKLTCNACGMDRQRAQLMVLHLDKLVNGGV